MNRPGPWKIIVWILPLALLAWAGCSKEEEEEVLPEVSFSFDLPALAIAVDSAQVAAPSGVVFGFEGSAALGQALTANGFGTGQLVGVGLNKARLYFSDPVGSYYNALQSVTVRMAVGDGQPVTVASLDSVPNGAQALVLGLMDVDVAAMLRSNDARLVVRMEFDGPVPPVTGHSLVLGAQAVVLP